MDPKTDDITMIGFMVANDREKVIQAKPEMLAEFDRRVDHKHYAPMNFYPIEITKKYQEEAAKIIYGDAGPESIYKMGQWDYRMIIDTQLGKVLKSLYLKDLYTTIHALPKMISSSSKGFRVRVEDSGEREVHVIFENDPYLETYFLGLFTEALKDQFQGKGSVTVQNHADGTRVFIVKW